VSARNDPLLRQRVVLVSGEIAALSRAHRVLSPDEAKALGFIDEVVQPPR
jgi:ATP-dependent protease ClpP protease subunit